MQTVMGYRRLRVNRSKPEPRLTAPWHDGAFIAPGLIDAHVHYSQTGWVDGRPDTIDLRAEFPYDSVNAALRTEKARFDRANLCSGVASVFDVGGYSWPIPPMQVNERALDAPRVVVAGPLLATIDHWVNTAMMRSVRSYRERYGNGVGVDVRAAGP